MHVSMIRVKKIAMTYYKINNRIFRAASLRGVTPEHVVYYSPVVHTAWDTAIAIVACLSTGILQSFDLIALWIVHKREIWIAIAAGGVVFKASVIKPVPDPVLKMILLISSAHLLDQNSMLPSPRESYEGIRAGG